MCIKIFLKILKKLKSAKTNKVKKCNVALFNYARQTKFVMHFLTFVYFMEVTLYQNFNF